MKNWDLRNFFCVIAIGVLITIASMRALEASEDRSFECLEANEVVEFITLGRDAKVPAPEIYRMLTQIGGWPPEETNRWIVMIYYQFPNKSLGWLSSSFLGWCMKGEGEAA